MAATGTERYEGQKITVTNNKVTTVRAFDIKTDLPNQFAYAYNWMVANHPIGTGHPNWANLYVSNHTMDPKGANLFTGLVTYENATASISGDPTALAAKWNFNTSLENIAIDRDISGNPIVNSAYDAFDTNPTSSVMYVTASATKWINNLVLATFLNYVGKTNSATWNFGFGAVYRGQALCVGIYPNGEITQGQTYYQIKYDFLLKQDPIDDRYAHNLIILDQGYRAATTLENNLPYPPIVTAGQLVNKPQLLNGHGGNLKGSNVNGAAGTPAGATLSANANRVFMKWLTRNEIDFNALNL